MYAIKSGGKAVGYADEINYIRLHSNGCYVLCSEAEAEGICAKIAKEYTDAKTGETVTHIVDTVFRLTDEGLHGTEPKCEIEVVSGAQVVADKDKELSTILTELESEVS